MNTAIVKREFEGHAIEFDLHNKNVMVNATDMTKIYGKRIGFFLQNKQTKEFISALKGATIIAPLTKNNNESENPEIVNFRGRNGTYFHRVLALKYAAWLNPKFEVWVYMTIEDILFKKQEEIKALNPRKEFVPYFIPDELVYHGKVTVDEMSKDLMRRVLDIAEYYNIKTGNVNGWLFRRAQILYDFKVSKHHYYSADGYSKFATVARMGVFHCIVYIAQFAHDFIVKLNPKIAPRPHLIKAEDCPGLYYLDQENENYGKVYY